MSRSETRLIASEFYLTAQEYVSRLEEELREDVRVLDFARSLYLASDSVEEGEFLTFVDPLLEGNPGIQAIEWVPHVLHEERARFEHEAREAGHVGYEIQELRDGALARAADRPEYFPVRYVTPGVTSNILALGFDHSTIASRSRAMNEAATERSMQATEVITILRIGGGAGFLCFVPVYWPRSTELRGYIVGLFNGMDLFESAFDSVPGNDTVDIKVIDVESGATMYEHTSPMSVSSTLSQTLKVASVSIGVKPMVYKRVVTNGDRSILFIVRPRYAFIYDRRTGQPFVALIALVVGVSAFTAYVHNAIRQRQLVETLVSHRTRELEEERHRLELAMQAGRATEERLRQSNEDLEKFAYVASHDLKEPLRMISGYSGLLQDRYKGKLDDDADDFISYVIDGVFRMENLVDDLLHFSRAGRLEKARKTLVCVEVRTALQNAGLAIKNSNAEIHIDLPDGLVYTGSRLAQVFQNLISNAVKFCKNEESPKIEITYQRTISGESQFSVKDYGIGIDPEYLSQVFEAFKRLHTWDKYPGSGIGLVICKRIIESQGGRIWVESEPGMSTTFYFTLMSCSVEVGDDEA